MTNSPQYLNIFYRESIIERNLKYKENLCNDPHYAQHLAAQNRNNCVK